MVGVETRIAVGVVAAREVILGQAWAPEAFGDVLAGHLQMDAAGVDARGLGTVDEGAQLGENALERRVL